MHNPCTNPRRFPFNMGFSRDGRSAALARYLVAALCLASTVSTRGGSEAHLEAAGEETEAWIEYEVERAWSFGLGLDFLSQYAFRDVLSTEGPVMQPFAYFSYKNLTFDVYANMNLDGRDANRGRFDEIDFDCYLTAEIGNLTIEPGFTYYHYLQDDETPDSGDFFLSLTHPVGPFSAVLINSVDVLEYPGFYYGSLGLYYDWQITEGILLDASVSVNYSDDPDEDDDEYWAIYPSLSLTFDIGENAYITPHVSFSHFLHSEIDPVDDDYFIYGVTLGYDF